MPYHPSNRKLKIAIAKQTQSQLSSHRPAKKNSQRCTMREDHHRLIPAGRMQSRIGRENRITLAAQGSARPRSGKPFPYRHRARAPRTYIECHRNPIYNRPGCRFNRGRRSASIPLSSISTHCRAHFLPRCVLPVDFIAVCRESLGRIGLMAEVDRLTGELGSSSLRYRLLYYGEMGIRVD